MDGKAFCGIDTSNYTTSVSLVNCKQYVHERKLLDVNEGQLGLRQSEAVFCHVKNLGKLTEKLFSQNSCQITAIGVSQTPRDCIDSYMPCFLVGKMTAQCMSSALKVPVYYFSHQAGHIAAAVFSAKREDLFDKSFVAFHVSGGTTECLFVKNILKGDMQIICASNDLHVGQVVDRCAHMLGLPFPGGKALDELSLKSTKNFKNKIVVKNGNPCFSGIENQCKDMLLKGCDPSDIAKFCLDSLADGLCKMIDFAREKVGCKTIVFSGGVMSNTILREKTAKKCDAVFASKELSCDNSVGIAKLALLKHKKGE